MKYCPNTTCKYLLKYGRPAEFADRPVCTECGTLLGSVAPAPRSPAAAARAPLAASSDAWTRLAVTAGAGALVALGLHLPLLGLQTSVFGGGAEERLPLRLLEFGATPFLSGYVLVELVAVLVPGLRERRVGGARARAGLDRASLVVGALLLALQIQALVRSTAGSELQAVLPPPGLLWAQLLAAHAGLLALARLVTRRGLGNGFAVVTLVGSASLAVEAVSKLGRALQAELVAPGTALLIVLVCGGVAWGAVRLSRAARPAEGPGPTCAPFPISGLVPWSISAALVVLPVTLANFLPVLAPLARGLQSSQLAYLGLATFLNVDATLLFGLLFFSPRAVGRAWAKWVTGIDETGVVARARALLPRAMVLAVVAIAGLPLVSPLLASGVDSLQYALADLVVTVVIAMDLVDEWRARRQLGALVPVYQVNRMAEVEPIAFVLRAAGIPCHLRTFAWRATLQFFGPYAPVEVLVPAAHADAATALLEGGRPSGGSAPQAHAA